MRGLVVDATFSACSTFAATASLKYSCLTTCARAATVDSMSVGSIGAATGCTDACGASNAAMMPARNADLIAMAIAERLRSLNFISRVTIPLDRFLEATQEISGLDSEIGLRRAASAPPERSTVGPDPRVAFAAVVAPTSI